MKHRHDARPTLERLEDRTVPTASATDTYVGALYQGLLNRAVDPQGLSYWGGLLNTGATREQVAAGILQSGEGHDAQTAGLYGLLLGHASSAADLQFWRNVQAAGTTPAEVEANILAAPEFAGHVGNGNWGFLNGVYQAALGHALDEGGRAFWGTALAGGQSPLDVARGILASAEAQTVQIRNDYRQFLGQNLDGAGQSYWLDRFQGGVSGVDIAAGILGSQTFFGAVQDYVKSLTTDLANATPGTIAQLFIQDTSRFLNTLRDDIKNALGNGKQQIQVSPAQLDVTATAGAATATLMVTNSGPQGSVLNFALRDESFPVPTDVSLQAGQLQPGQSATSTLTFHVAGVAAGQYHGTLTVVDRTGLAAPQQVKINLTVPTSTPAPGQITLKGDISGTWTAQPSLPDVGIGQKLTGSGTVGPLGAVQATGTIALPGFVFSGHATGTFQLTGAQGSVTVSLLGPSQPGFATKLPTDLQYTITGGTGAYASATGGGTAMLHETVALSGSSVAATFTLSF